jgi:hypothetical protein
VTLGFKKLEILTLVCNAFEVLKQTQFTCLPILFFYWGAAGVGTSHTPIDTNCSPIETSSSPIVAGIALNGTG